MRILIAPDKFKGSLSAKEVAENIAIGLRDVRPDAVIETLPIADGGEGTAAAIGEACGGERMTCAAHDALGRPIEAEYFSRPERSTAVMEMSEAAGMWRIKPADRDLLRADTYGVGEMIDHAITQRAREIVIGLGGSATNDGGLGMARALGYRFFGNEHEIGSTRDLVGLMRIVPPKRPAGPLLQPQIIAAVDVRNPLLGPGGATRTFGPQKGGTAEQLAILERALARLADIVHCDLGCDFREAPGAGAAGGLGFGLMSFCGATIRSGFDVVSEFIGLRSAIERSDVVITGEGRLDDQTLEGKAPAGVARTARTLRKRVFAIVGSDNGSERVHALFDAVLALDRPGTAAGESQRRAAEFLRDRARELARMM